YTRALGRGRRDEAAGSLFATASLPRVGSKYEAQRQPSRRRRKVPRRLRSGTGPGLPFARAPSGRTAAPGAGDGQRLRGGVGRGGRRRRGRALGGGGGWRA